jgi:hypothetical protein
MVDENERGAEVRPRAFTQLKHEIKSTPANTFLMAYGLSRL